MDNTAQQYQPRIIDFVIRKLSACGTVTLADVASEMAARQLNHEFFELVSRPVGKLEQEVKRDETSLEQKLSDAIRKHAVVWRKYNKNFRDRRKKKGSPPRSRSLPYVVPRDEHIEMVLKMANGANNAQIQLEFFDNPLTVSRYRAYYSPQIDYLRQLTKFEQKQLVSEWRLINAAP